MHLPGLRSIFPFFPPTWDWIQVEVTSDCNAACIYCPRTIYKGCWESRHLPLETFGRLIPSFSETRHVHLQGWGEPFLHPDFFEMAAIAKSAGCRVGTTTNGMLLNREKIERVVESRIDIVAFSLAGTGEENDRIRRGTRLAKVFEAMRTLNEEKQRQRKETPAVHVAYMLLRSGIEKLSGLPDLLRGCGVGDLVISFLDFIPSEPLRSEAIAPASEAEYKDLRSHLEQVKETGRQHHLSVHHPLESMVDRDKGCTENVQRAVCVASDGSVTPCVYVNLQAPGASFMLQGEMRPCERMVFGNIRDKSLRAIWHEKAYSAFRDSFQKGELSALCDGCSKLNFFSS
jgi:MoaA/NifB/PqqE/SkfB family radical SAM enzyme